MNLKGKKIVLGITGGIAAYKCAELIRLWMKEGAEVEVIMTSSAQQFITPLTMETITGRSVHTELFPKDKFSATLHIDLSDWADVVVITPATANIIAKIRAGLGDDLLSTICIAAWKKMIIAPAMNSNMCENPALKENIGILQKNGYQIIHPTDGDLACGYTGVGRLPDPEIIDYWVRHNLQKRSVLKKKTILITAGRTEEEIDPVRIITNRSSGRMGFALAQEAFFKGAKVILVSGPNNLKPPPGVEYIPVTSAKEMHEQVMKNIENSDVVIGSAAVSDYRSKSIAKQKIKKEKKEINLEMISTIDILAEVSKKKGEKILVGFAVETDNEKKNAMAKLQKKNLDIVVLNNPFENGAGFATKTNKVTIFSQKSKEINLPVLDKTDVAEKILDEIEKFI